MKIRKSRATETGTLIAVRLQAGLLSKVDEYRTCFDPVITRPEAIRMAVDEYLRASQPEPDVVKD